MKHLTLLALWAVLFITVWLLVVPLGMTLFFAARVFEPVYDWAGYWVWSLNPCPRREPRAVNLADCHRLGR